MSQQLETEAESYYRLGKFSRFATQFPHGTLFNNQFDSVWSVLYPGLSAEQSSRLIYDELSRWVAVVMVFDDLGAADPRFRNDYTQVVSRTMAATVRDDPRWKRIFTFDGPDYGPVSGFRNLSPQAGGFEGLLWCQTLALPSSMALCSA